MKYTITIFFTVLFFGSCSEKPKDYATISGKISNPNKLNQIIISNRAGYSKQIKVKKPINKGQSRLLIREFVFLILIIVQYSVQDAFFFCWV